MTFIRHGTETTLLDSRVSKAWKELNNAKILLQGGVAS